MFLKSFQYLFFKSLSLDVKNIQLLPLYILIHRWSQFCDGMWTNHSPAGDALVTLHNYLLDLHSELGIDIVRTSEHAYLNCHHSIPCIDYYSEW